MIGREKRVLLRHYLEQGMNKAVIARDLGVSRRTVYHWIETGQLDRELDEERVGYGPRCLMPSKLDPYKPLIDTRLKEYAKLTAVRLFKEVRAAGYPGSYNQVKRYVRKVRPRPPEEPVVRFETAPGRQGQVDFAHFRLPWGKRYALIVVLGYSRLLWVQFYTRQTMKALMHGLESSFSYFGGVPSELESRRVCRRLHQLRGWGHEKERTVLPRSAGAGGSDGFRSRARVQLTVVGDLLYFPEDRVY